MILEQLALTEDRKMGTVHINLEDLLGEYDVARITRLSVASVRRWRYLNQGPKYLKLGSAVRYRAEDITKWLETRPSGGEQDPPEGR